MVCCLLDQSINGVTRPVFYCLDKGDKEAHYVVMGLFRLIKNIINLSAAYEADIKKAQERQLLLDKGLTQEWVRELVANASVGVTMTVNFPGGHVISITRNYEDAVQVQSQGNIWREKL